MTTGLVLDVAGARTPGQRAWRRFCAHRLAMASLGLLVLLAALAVAGPWIAAWRGIDPTATDLLARLEPPSARHWLGTNALGQDLLAQILRGMQKSMLIGVCVALISTVIAATVGAISGYFGGWRDHQRPRHGRHVSELLAGDGAGVPDLKLQLRPLDQCYGRRLGQRHLAHGHERSSRVGVYLLSRSQHCGLSKLEAQSQALH